MCNDALEQDEVADLGEEFRGIADKKLQAGTNFNLIVVGWSCSQAGIKKQRDLKLPSS